MDEKLNIGMAGEFRVVSELLKQGFNASVTFGNAKGTDIIILREDKTYLRIEVKTSKNGRNFVTSYFPKYAEKSSTDPDYWILFLPNKDASTDGDRFFILSHTDVRQLQLVMNKGNETKKGEGVDNITVKLLESSKDEFENNWNKLH